MGSPSAPNISFVRFLTPLRQDDPLNLDQSPISEEEALTALRAGMTIDVRLALGGVPCPWFKVTVSPPPGGLVEAPLIGWDARPAKAFTLQRTDLFVRLLTYAQTLGQKFCLAARATESIAWLDDANDADDDEPPINDDLGPEVDDEGGMTEYRHALPHEE